MMNLDLTLTTLLPHDHPMILLDTIVEHDAESVVARITPEIGKPFASADGSVPGWVGMEYMAQAIAAWAGIRAQRVGEPVRVGFLLGTRCYDITVDSFPCGHALDITARMIYDDDGLSAFGCSIKTPGSDTNVLAQATINTFQPANVDDYMATEKG